MSPRLVWNASASVPIGLYLVAPHAPVTRGDLVLAWLPDDARSLAAERGYLPATVPLVKRIAAIAGDTICAADRAISVNGRTVAIRLSADGQGRQLPVWIGCRTLAKGEVFLLAEAATSFDGRYFGAIESSRIVGWLVPIWTR